MTTIKMTLCDNPRCGSMKAPESIKPYRPPYAWLTLKGGWFGSGPSVSIEVCSLECVEPALEDAAKQQEQS